MADYNFSYKGARKIRNVLSYEGLDEQMRKLEQFDQAFAAEMGAAMEDAVEIASAHAQADLRKKIKGAESTGELESSIYGKVLTKKGDQVRGAIGTKMGIKAFVQEAGRMYNGKNGRYRWIGKFYLYYGIKEKSAEILAKYQAANQRIVERMVVRA